MSWSVALVAVSLVLAGGVIVTRRVWFFDGYRETKTSAAMRASEIRRTRSIELGVDSLPMGVIVVNAAASRVFTNIAAKRFDDGRHGEAIVAAAVDEVAQQAVANKPERKTVELWGPPIQSFEVVGSPIVEGERCVGAVITVEDTTVATELHRVRRDLVANVSHELRTPVGAMMSLSEILEQSDDDEVRDRMIRRIKAQAIRLTEIVDDLLVLARVESSANEVFEPVDLTEVVESVVEQASETAEQRSVCVVGLNHAKGPTVVDGVPKQLMSLVANLCDNAIKYSPDGSRVVLIVDRNDSSVFLTVQDTGLGIPESELDRIFERFYRVDMARSRNTGGTGLGLAIVRNVLRNHGGSISVRSTEGLGSTFVCEFPLAGVVAKTRKVSA